jgi:hypothetical protein
MPNRSSRFCISSSSPSKKLSVALVFLEDADASYRRGKKSVPGKGALKLGRVLPVVLLNATFDTLASLRFCQNVDPVLQTQIFMAGEL